MKEEGYRFNVELQLIEDEAIRQFVAECMKCAPEYFWTIPSSSTGKHHPADERGPGGLVLHTRRVVRVAVSICEALDLSGIVRDCIVAACIMHDFCKNGYPDNTGHTVNGHGFLWYNVMQEAVKTLAPLVETRVAKAIGSLIAFHMGKYDAPYFVVGGDPEMVVQLADYISSREYVDISTEYKG